MRVLIIILTLALSACSQSHHLTECRGSFVAANPGRWQPTTEELSK